MLGATSGHVEAAVSRPGPCRVTGAGGVGGEHVWCLLLTRPYLPASAVWAWSGHLPGCPGIQAPSGGQRLHSWGQQMVPHHQAAPHLVHV